MTNKSYRRTQRGQGDCIKPKHPHKKRGTALSRPPFSLSTRDLKIAEVIQEQKTAFISSHTASL